MPKKIIQIKPKCFKCGATVSHKMKYHHIRFSKGDLAGTTYHFFTCPQHVLYKPSEVEEEIKKGNPNVLDLVDGITEENIQFDYR